MYLDTKTRLDTCVSRILDKLESINLDLRDYIKSRVKCIGVLEIGSCINFRLLDQYLGVYVHFISSLNK